MTSAPTSLDQVAETVIPTTITDYLNDAQLTYALYTISDRAIPAASDGLKPGQRRMLYSMLLDGVGPDNEPHKSARLVGNATGSLHPHGGAAMYGTLVNMAVPHRRVRLVDGIGSFGQSPGDTPASDRYTQARLSDAGYELVRELSDKAVPMRPTYDHESVEPEFLPVRFPALLIGGGSGMAEAFATQVPAHNPREVMALVVAVIDDPEITTAQMREIAPGPDWGTGGVIVGDQSGIDDYYNTGRGRMTVRGVVEIDKRNLVISQLPPGVNMPTLIADIRSKAKEGLIPGIADVTDLSDLDTGMNLVLSVRRGNKPEDVRETLWRETDLESTFAASMVALDRESVPRWWSMRELIDEFLDLRDEVVARRSRSRLGKVSADLHTARALAAVALDKERAADIILKAADRKAAAEEIADGFDLDEVQSGYVVALPLYRLTKADALDAQRRAEELAAEEKKLQRLISSPAARKKVIRAELIEMSRLFDADEYARRTRFDASVVAATGTGGGDDAGLSRWLLDVDSGVLGEEGLALSDDSLLWAAFTDGRVKMFAGRGLPRRINPTTIAPDISALLACGVVGEGQNLLLTTRAGKVLRLDPAKINPQGVAGNGVAGIKLDENFDGDTVVGAHVITDADALLTISGDAHKVTAASDIPVKGRGGRGVGTHILRGTDTGVIESAVAAGFEVNGKKVRPQPRSKATVKKVAETWQAAE